MEPTDPLNWTPLWGNMHGTNWGNIQCYQPTHLTSHLYQETSQSTNSSTLLSTSKRKCSMKKIYPSNWTLGWSDFFLSDRRGHFTKGQVQYDFISPNPNVRRARQHMCIKVFILKNSKGPKYNFFFKSAWSFLLQ